MSDYEKCEFRLGETGEDGYTTAICDTHWGLKWEYAYDNIRLCPLGRLEYGFPKHSTKTNPLPTPYMWVEIHPDGSQTIEYTKDDTPPKDPNLRVIK